MTSWQITLIIMAIGGLGLGIYCAWANRKHDELYKDPGSGDE